MWWPVLELARKRTWSAAVIATLGTDRECYKRVVVCGILVIVAEVVCGGFARERERERERMRRRKRQFWNCWKSDM
jgi:hypothetical protein